MYYRGKETEEICQVAFRLPGQGATLSLFENLFYNENKKSQDLDPFDVYLITGKVI